MSTYAEVAKTSEVAKSTIVLPAVIGTNWSEITDEKIVDTVRNALTASEKLATVTSKLDLVERELAATRAENAELRGQLNAIRSTLGLPALEASVKSDVDAKTKAEEPAKPPKPAPKKKAERTEKPAEKDYYAVKRRNGICLTVTDEHDPEWHRLCGAFNCRDHEWAATRKGFCNFRESAKGEHWMCACATEERFCEEHREMIKAKNETQ
jgi:hypothetical protein